MRAALLALVVAAAGAGCSGGSGPLGPEYEYEEDLTLSLDGSATLVVNASIPALVALRGLALDTSLDARADHLRDQIRQVYSTPYTSVGRISTWNHRGRRFVGVYVRVPDIRELSKAPPFAWGTYDLHRDGDLVVYRERLTKPTRRRAFSIPSG